MSAISENLLSRTTLNQEILGGKPIIRGMRISAVVIATQRKIRVRRKPKTLED